MSEETQNSEQENVQSPRRWYVARVISGQEKKVKKKIEIEIERLGLQDRVSQILIPTEKVFQIRNGKKVSKERNFFPGYVLIEADLQGEVPYAIKNVSGVIGFLGSEEGGDPSPLRDSEINRILGKVDDASEGEGDVNIPFMVGESVRVIDGPFTDFSGVIEDINEEKKKLKVMVKIFGRKTPLELSYMQVEKES